MMNFFEYGDVVRCAGAFLTSLSSAIDPSVVKFSYQAAATGILTTYTYGTDAALVKDSTGNYHVDIDTSESSGVFSWRFFSTGTGQAAEQDQFYVRPKNP